MDEKFLNHSGLKTLWTKLKSTFAKVVHTHAASDITSGTFGTSRIANDAITSEKVKDGAITPSKLNIINLPYQREANGGKNWHCVFKIVLPTDRTTAESRHSKAYRVFDLYIDGYNNKGKYSYVGRLGLNFSISTGMTIADYNFLTHGYARAKWILGRPYDSNYDCKIVKTESSIEFFILSNSWDTSLALICEKQYYAKFGDGVFDFTIVPNAYTIEEFEIYCSDKVVVDSELDDMKIGSATSADSATKATQDGSGNNIVNTYATKKALGSVNQSISGLTSGVNSKLEKNGSNASSTTTYNVLNAAAGGANYEITDEEEIVLNHPDGSTAYKRTLDKFIDYLRSKLIRDSFSPPTSNNIAPTVGAVTTVIESKEKNLKETYFDAAPISINKDVETAILEIPYSSAPDLYQRIYELNISSNIAHQTNFKIIFCPAVNSSKSFTTNTRAYILGFSNDTTRGLFRFCTTDSGVVLSCKYTSDNSSSATRQIAISMNVARGTGFTKVNKPITDYGTITSAFYLNDSTYVKPYVTSDELNTAINNIRKENYSWTNASTYNGFIGMPMTICWNGGTSVAANTLFNYGTDYADDGRILVFVNGTSGLVSVTGLVGGSYSVGSGRTLLIVKWSNQYYRQEL